MKKLFRSVQTLLILFALVSVVLAAQPDIAVGEPSSSASTPSAETQKVTLNAPIGEGWHIRIISTPDKTRSSIINDQSGILDISVATIKDEGCGPLADAIEDAASAIETNTLFDERRVAGFRVSIVRVESYKRTGLGASDDNEDRQCRFEVVVEEEYGGGFLSSPVKTRLACDNVRGFAQAIRQAPKKKERLLSAINFDRMWGRELGPDAK